MPIVISYEDIDALGALAYKGGEMLGTAQRRQEGRGTRERQEQRDLDWMMQIRQQQLAQKEAASEREWRNQMFEADQQYRYTSLGQQAASEEAQMAMTIEQAGLTRQARTAEAEIRTGAQSDLAEQIHQQNLERLGREAEFGKYQYRGKPSEQPSLGTGGIPNKAMAADEMQQFKHLMPSDRYYTGAEAARELKEGTTTAEGFTQRSTDQLRQFLNNNPDTKWKGFLQAVIQARESVAVQSQMPGVGSEAGRRRPGGTSLSKGGSLTEPLKGETNQDLDEIARDPVKLQEYLNRLRGTGGATWNEGSPTYRPG